MEDFMEQPSREERGYCSRIGAIPAWVFVGSLAWSFIVAGVVYALRATPSSTALMLLGAAQYLLTVPVAYLLVRRVPRTIINQRPLSLKRAAQWFCIGIAILWIGSIVGTVANDFAYSAVGHEPYDLITTELSGLPIWMVILIACIIAPIAEEILFRGLLAGRLARYGERRAVVLSALLFGLFHGNFAQFFYAFGLGMLLAYAYFRTGRLRVPIVLHTLFNLFGSASLLFPDTELMTLLYGVSMILLSVAGAVFGVRVLRRLTFEPAVVEVPLKVVVCNVGIVLTVLTCLAQFAYVLNIQ